MLYNDRMWDIKIEEAIKFLVHAIETSWHNTKPVILHSIRVANILAFLWYDTDIIIWGLLHDLYEDADISLSVIAEQFGANVAHQVDCNSFDKNISDKTEQYKAMYDKCLQWGKNAAVIKAIDLYDNSFYYYLAKNKESRDFLREKYNYFVELSKEILYGEKAYELLVGRQKVLSEFIFTS